MKFNGYRLFLRSSIYLGIGYFASFVLYYLSNYIYSVDALYYAWQFLQKGIYLLLPIIAALITLISSAFIGSGKACLNAIPLALVRTVYFVPYFYLMIITEGFDSVESLFYSALLALGEAIISYAVTVLIFTAMRFIIKKRGTGRELSHIMTEPTVLDTSNPTSLAFLAVSLFSFVYFTVGEVIDTVAFISDYGFTFNTTELIYTVISYIFDILVPLLYYFILSLLKNYIISSRMYTTTK